MAAAVQVVESDRKEMRCLVVKPEYRKLGLATEIIKHICALYPGVQIWFQVYKLDAQLYRETETSLVMIFNA